MLDCAQLATGLSGTAAQSRAAVPRRERSDDRAPPSRGPPARSCVRTRSPAPGPASEFSTCLPNLRPVAVAGRSARRRRGSRACQCSPAPRASAAVADIRSRRRTCQPADRRVLPASSAAGESFMAALPRADLGRCPGAPDRRCIRTKARCRGFPCCHDQPERVSSDRAVMAVNLRSRSSNEPGGLGRAPGHRDSCRALRRCSP